MRKYVVFLCVFHISRFFLGFGLKSAKWTLWSPFWCNFGVVLEAFGLTRAPLRVFMASLDRSWRGAGRRLRLNGASSGSGSVPEAHFECILGFMYHLSEVLF